MSDSEDYREELPQQPRQKRHRFKTFAERVADVDVDVYRRLGQVKETPHGDAPSFTVEALNKWRELNSSQPFLEVAAAIHPLTETLPQLIFHAQEVFDLLLAKVDMQHALGLPGVLALHAALARDLQGDYVPVMLPRLMAALAALVDDQGADRDTDTLEEVFTCLSMLCKHLSRHLVGRLPWLLAQTRGIRYARAPHVRLFAAQSFGYLLRQVAAGAAESAASQLPPTTTTLDTAEPTLDEPAAPEQVGGAATPGNALRRAVRAVLAEQALVPSAARTDGAGLLLAESVLGVSHGLHSRAPVILELVCSEDALKVEDLRIAGPAAQGITTEMLRARATAVASVCLQRVLSHLRRGKGEVLWQVLLHETNQRLDKLQESVPTATASQSVSATVSSRKGADKKQSRSKRPKTATAQSEAGPMEVDGAAAASPTALLHVYASVARSVGLVSQSVAFFRGSRVETYQPLHELIQRLMQPWAWPPADNHNSSSGPNSSGPVATSASTDVPTASTTTAASRGKKRSRAAEVAVAEVAAPVTATQSAQEEEQQHEEDTEPFLQPSLTRETLSLVTGVVYGHIKVVGASEGLSALSAHIHTWAPCFSQPGAHELLPFVLGLLTPPAGTEVARLFAARMMGALGGLVMGGTAGKDGGSVAGVGDVALGLLVQACQVLQPQTAGQFTAASLPLLLTAQPHGVKLAASVRSMLQSWAEALQQQLAGGAAGHLALAAGVQQAQLACAWAVLQLLPHACENRGQAVSLCQSAQAAALAAVQALERRSDASVQHGVRDQLLSMHGLATQMLASLLVAELEAAGTPAEQARASAALVQAAEESLAWLQTHASSMGAAQGAGAMLQAVAQHAADTATARQLLSVNRLQELVPILLPHLSSPSQTFRAAVLQVLCSFEQPALLPVAGSNNSQTTGVSSEASTRAKTSKVEVLPLMHAINSEPCTLEAGRRWSVALIRQGGHVEYNRIPDYLVPALVHSLLGVLRVRFLPLWPAAVQALASCLEHATKVSWPIVCQALQATQDEFLSGSSAPSHHGHDQGGKGRGKGHRGKQQHRQSEAGSDEEADEEGLAFDGEPLEGAGTQQGRDHSQTGLAKVPSLESRFQEACGQGDAASLRDSTDAANRLTHLLKSFAKTPASALEPLSQEWVPVFLAYASEGSRAAQAEATGSQGVVTALSRVGARAYRAQLSEWLSFLSGLKSARALHRSSEVQVAVAQCLDAEEPALQTAALKSLQAFKLKYMNPYIERLLRLADNKTLRSELAAFPLAADADNGVSAAHRAGLTLILTRVLFPKLRRRTGRLAGKGALGSARAAVLNFLGFAEPLELRPLIELFLTPMQQVFVTPPASAQPAGSTSRQRSPHVVTREQLQTLDSMRVLPAPWWLAHLGSEDTEWWLKAVDQEQLAALPARKKVGFLNAFEDLLERLGHRLAPLFPALLALTLRILEEATAPLQQPPETSGTSMQPPQPTSEEDRSREMRSGCLKILSQLWRRFPGTLDYNQTWGVFLPAVAPLMPRLAVECSADKEPPLISCTLALASSPNLLPVLGNAPTTTITLHPAQAVPAAPAQPQPPPMSLALLTRSPAQQLAEVWGTGQVPAWAQQGLGGHLLRACIAALSARHCSQASRTAILDIVDFILDEAMPDVPKQAGAIPAAMQTGDAPAAPTPMPSVTPLLSLILQPWLDELLVALKSIITTAWEGRSDAAQVAAAGALMKRPGVLRRRPQYRAHRELGILERLGGAVTAAETAHLLGDALAVLVTGVVTGAAQRRGARARLDEVGLGRALSALSALWMRLAAAHGLGSGPMTGAPDITVSDAAQDLSTTQAAVERYWDALAPLALRLQSREARIGLAAAYTSAATLLAAPSAQRAAALLSDLTAWSTTMLDEPDYDRRMAAFTALQVAAWQELGRTHALPVLMACLHDARNAGDLALRQSAATALERFIQAAAEGGSTGVDTGLDTGLGHLVPRVLYPQLRSQLGSISAAVRQEHLQLLRALVLANPVQFSDLIPLASPQDPETDLFLNVAHLQVHRQVRALNRLAKQCTALAQHQDSDSGVVVGASDRTEGGGLISLRCIMDIAVPLIQAAIGYDATDGSERAHDASQTDADKGANVVDAGQKALAAAAAALPWQQYDQLLSMCLRSMRAQPCKASIRAVCQVLDAFHFPLPQQLDANLVSQYQEYLATSKRPAAAAVEEDVDMAGQEGEEDDEEADTGMEGVEGGQEEEEEEEEEGVGTERAAKGRRQRRGGLVADDGSDSDKEEAEAGTGAAVTASGGAAVRGSSHVSTDKQSVKRSKGAEEAHPGLQELPEQLREVHQAQVIQRALVRRVLPVLHRMLVSNSDKAVVPTARAPVALAIAKLVKLLPPEIERRELPRALGTLATLLLDRHQRVRDDTRAVLVSMAKELGPQYMPYMCNVLRATLPDKGFTAHVLGYTLHALLEAVVGHLLSRKARAQMAALSDLPTPATTGAETRAGEDADTLLDLDMVPGDDTDDDDDGDGSDSEGEGDDGKKPGGGAGKPARGQRGVLDDAVELAVPIIENEIFGQVAAAKEVAQFANNYKEAKKVRGYESFMLLAAAVSFDTHLEPLMDLVRDKLSMASVPSVRNRLNHLLQYMVRGMAANPTATAAPLARWLTVTLEEGIQLEEHARARARAAAEAAVSAPRGEGEDKVAAPGTVIQGTVSKTGRAKRTNVLDESDAAALHYHMVVGAALQVLRLAMRRGALTGRSPVVLDLLGPLVPTLVRSIKSRHAPSVVLALRALCHLVTLPLHQLPEAAPAAGKAVTQLLRRAPSATHVLSQEGLRLLASLMRACTTYQPTTAQIRFILSWLFSERHADEALERGAGFTLVRAVLDRRLVVPEVYDIMNWVQQLMVKSQAAHVRASAASCLLQFLLDYPLGPKRLATHLAFLASNLSYEHEEGRLQVLGMINQVVSKFPEEVVAEQAELFTLPLVTRLVNEGSPRGRQAVADALRSLLKVLPAGQIDTFVGFCKQWLSGDNPQLRRAALQSLGLLVEAEGGQRFGKRLTDGALVEPLLAVLRRQQYVTALQPADALESGEVELVGSCPGWYEAYYCLLLLEKMISSHPQALAWPDKGKAPHVVFLWEAVPPLLLHRHVWVRKAAARLVGLALATPSIANPMLTSRPGRAGELAYALFMQLNCAMADEATCKQAVKCLIPLVVRLHQEWHESGAGTANGHTAAAAHMHKAGNTPADKTNGHVADAAHHAATNGVGGSGFDEADSDADGDGAGDSEAGVEEDEADEVAAQEEAQEGDGDEQDVTDTGDYDDPAVRCVTLPGLMRRMARLADTIRFPYAQQRLAALRWIAAVATKLGASGVAPFLDVLIVPLYRLSQPPATGQRGVPPHVQEAMQLGEEVMGHLRGLLGADTLLAAYNAARETVTRRKAERKQAAAVKALLDPAAAAADRIRRGKRKSEGRKAKMEHAKRVRSASTYGGQKKGHSTHGGGGGRGSSGSGSGRSGGQGRLGPKALYSKSGSGGKHRR